VTKEPLAKFAVLRTRDPDELRERVAPLYAVSRLEAPGGKGGFRALLNHHQLQNVGLSYARYGAPVRATMSNTDFYAQGFGIRGRGEVVVEGRTFEVANNVGGTGGPGSTAHLSYDAGVEHVFIRIKPEALIKKLSALLGGPVASPIKLRGEYDRPALAAQYRFLNFVISELDRSDGGLPPLMMAEFEQALIVSYLCANLSNYSGQLNGEQPAVAPWQVRRAAEFIEANWDQPITIEALALITGTSARSLFASFRKSLGRSPMALVKQVRLQHAKEMLRLGGPGVSVTSVALDCGFSNLGHFAKDYYASFGELPSNTLKRNKQAE
jgi:AraC-like DNA-binding protein